MLVLSYLFVLFIYYVYSSKKQTYFVEALKIIKLITIE